MESSHPSSSSLNLHGLATSLNANADSKPSWESAVEKELMKDFKAAAQSLTALYRSGRQASKRAYDSGYIAACQDLLSMIQHGVSMPAEAQQSHGDTEAHELTIGKIMDWIEGRLEAVKSRQEEELEEEERENVPPRNTKTTATVSPRLRNRPYPSSPSPPPPPLSVAPVSTPAKRVTKQRSLYPITPSTSSSANTSIDFPPHLTDNVHTVALGTKRRHAVMLLDSSSAAPSPISISASPLAVSVTNTPGFSSPTSFTGGGVGGSSFTLGTSATAPSMNHAPRRRTRSWKNLHNQNFSAGSTTGGGPDGSGAMMDVEDDGRERKRVARR